jgi:hypothetical protein
MTQRTVDSVLLPAIVLGMVAWLLFTDAQDAGINVLLWIASFVILWTVVRLRSGTGLQREERLLLLAALGLGVLITWHDTELLRLLNMAALAVTFGLLPLAAKGERSLIWELRIGEVIEAGVRLVARCILGLIPEVAAESARERSTSKLPVASILRGAVFCAIVLPVFVVLLSKADADFGHFLSGLFSFDVSETFRHVTLIGMFSWLGAGILGGALVQRWNLRGHELDIGKGMVGTVEVAMVLGSLNLLFMAYIGFQLSHFFGGASTVVNEAGVTYASYARGGFFELVVVSALVLPLLLVLESRVSADSEAPNRTFQLLALIMVALVYAIMASAMQRMKLYLDAFGLTEDRFFASALIAGLAVTFGWLLYAMFRGGMQRFAGGAIVAWAAWLLLLNVSNPAKIIVEHNMARAAAGKELDIEDLIRLGSDGVPAIVAGMNELDGDRRAQVEARLVNRYAWSSSEDWRDWNISRARASRLVPAR